MTSIDRFERQLPVALTDLADPRTPAYLVDILGQTARTRQRPAWASLERWFPMDITTQRVPMAGIPWRQLGLVALLALLLVAALAVAVGSRQRLTPAPLFGRAENGLIPYAFDGDILAGDPVTGDSTTVLADDAYDFEPVYSRDGTKIGFGRREDPSDPDVFSLMVMDPDGSNLRVVTPEPLRSVHWWDWAPNGDIVVVQATRGIRDMTIYDVDGTEAPRQLTHDIDVDSPSFRPPIGDEILFRGQVGSEVGVFVMKADGTDLRELIAPVASENLGYTLREPRYSPDGTQIAYMQWQDEPGIMRTYVMHADGSDVRELGADPEISFTGWPVWSNDGTRIAVQRGDEAGSRPYAIIDVATGAVVETGEAPSCCRIEWAPDDSAILFLQEVDGVSRQLLLDPAGGPSTEVPWNSDSFPSWQRLAE